MSPTLQEARTQFEGQQQLLVGKREEASKTQTQLRDIMSKLPSVTQKALRSGTFAGLKGRLRRRILGRTEKDISRQLGLVEGYKTSLTEYEEKTLKPFEQELKQAEIRRAEYDMQVAQTQEEQTAYNQAFKLYSKGKPLSFAAGSPSYKYLKKMYESKEFARQGLVSQIAEYQEDFPTEKLIVDWKNIRIKGVESGTFGESVSIQDYNKRIEELNKGIGGTSIVGDFIESSKDLSRIDKVKDIKGLQDISVSTDLFPFVSAQEQIMTPLPPDMLPGVKRFSVVELPPKESEIFKKQVAMRGPITGTLTYLGGAGERKLKELQMWRREKDPSYEPYQEAATRKLVGLGIQTAPYFTPAGPILLIGTGFESLISPEGKRQREQMQLGFEEKGFGKISSKALSYTPPALEIGLGAYGIKGQAQGFFQTRALKKPPTTVFMAEETSRRGISEIDILAKTRIGKQDYYGVVKQVGIPGPGRYDVLLSRGYTIAPELKVVRIPKTPYGKTIEILPMTGKVSRVPGTLYGKTTRAIKGEPFTAVGVGRELGQARYYGKDLFRRGRDIGRGAEARYAVKTEDKIIKGRVVGGFQKGEGEIVKYIGGKPIKLKITKEGKLSYKAKPTIFGYIKKGKPKVKEMEFDILPSGLKIKVQKQVQEQIVSQVSGLEVAAQAQAKKQAVSFFKKSQVTSKGGMIPFVSAKQEVIPRAEQKVVQVSGLVFEQIQKQKIKPFLISGVREKQKVKVKQVQKQVFKTLQGKKTTP